MFGRNHKEWTGVRTAARVTAIAAILALGAVAVPAVFDADFVTQDAQALLKVQCKEKTVEKTNPDGSTSKETEKQCLIEA